MRRLRAERLFNKESEDRRRVCVWDAGGPWYLSRPLLTRTSDLLAGGESLIDNSVVHTAKRAWDDCNLGRDCALRLPQGEPLKPHQGRAECEEQKVTCNGTNLMETIIQRAYIHVDHRVKVRLSSAGARR